MKKPEETNSLYISDTVNYALKHPPINITFTDPNTREYLGEFYEEGGELKFTGNVNESAKVFVEFICKLFNERIKQERQEMIDALREAEQLSEAVIMSRKGCCGDHYVYTPQIYKNYADKLYNQIKTALRDAGVEE